MRVSDIIAVIEAFAPASIQEKWDNTGLQVGSPSQEIHGVMIGFDCTADLVSEAVREGCDMIVTHHPLLFEGIRKVDPDDPVGSALMEAIRHGIAVYAAHTSADKVLAGVSGAMARRLGLVDIEVLESEAEGVGLGAVGNFPAPLSVKDALLRVKSAFGLPILRCSRPVSGMIGRVAMCGGSGSSLIESARAAGAQLYLCGDISYHHFFTPEGFMIADVGHFESEVEIVEVLCTLLRKNFPNFAIRVCADVSNNNPVIYF